MEDWRQPVMLKQRLIPCLLLRSGRCVKTVQFDNARDTGNPITSARIYDAQRADELIFLDITASKERRGTLTKIIKEVAEECFMPFTAGGGVSSVEEIRALLNAGADKVAINTAAVEKPDFITEAANKFGNQCIVICIDVKKTANKYEVITHGGTQSTGRDAIDWAREATRRGAGEILVNSIDRDGTMKGYDCELITAVVQSTDVPTIALGGVGTLDDFAHGLDAGASAVSAGSIFHFTEQSPIKARSYLKNEGYTVRA